MPPDRQHEQGGKVLVARNAKMELYRVEMFISCLIVLANPGAVNRKTKHCVEGLKKCDRRIPINTCA